MGFLMERNWRSQHPLPKGLETLEVIMKLAKSLLLGSAAGLFAVAGAQAADLPSRKAAPVEYVRVCSAFGAGFFYIPGTETCLRLGGRVRAEYRYFEPNTRINDATGFRARGRLNVDSRTATAYGTLRAFFRYEITGNTGNYVGTGLLNGGGQNATSVSLDKAFIQFAGITAGRLQSFFDFYADDINYGTGVFGGFGSDNGSTNLLAYTATFGGGFSATLSLEDRGQRQTATTVGGLQVGAGNFVYGGDRMPDVVANLRVDQPWGSAQLSGAVHQMFSNNIFVPVGLPGVGIIPDTEYGFAIQAGVKFNLPMIAAGDVLWLQAAYADGAVSYTGLGNANTSSGAALIVADGFIDQFGDVKKSQVFNLTAAFTHYFLPNFRGSIFGSYWRAENPTSSTGINLITGVRTGAIEGNAFAIGGQVVYSFVKDFDIGLEVIYSRVDPSGRVNDVNRNANIAGVQQGTIFSTGSGDNIEARLRFQRDF